MIKFNEKINAEFKQLGSGAGGWMIIQQGIINILFDTVKVKLPIDVSITSANVYNGI